MLFVVDLAAKAVTPRGTDKLNSLALSLYFSATIDFPAFFSL